MNSMRVSDSHQRIREKFVRWLKQFNPRFLDKWNRQFELDNPESAMCEAMFWEVLTSNGVHVEPNDLSDGIVAPDFLCSRNETRFFVEATVIGAQAATVRTTLEPMASIQHGFRHFDSMYLTVWLRFQKKDRHYISPGAPIVLAIGTFHQMASILDTCPCAEQFVANMDEVKRDQSNSFASPIAAILLAGFGCNPIEVFGVRHPQARWKFDAELLPNIPFLSGE